MEEQNQEKQEETVTMSKSEYDKSIQSAEDKLRTNYSKQIKALEDRVKELSPKEKSDSELALEQKIKDLEGKQSEIEQKEKYLNLQETLSSKGIDKSFANFIKNDINIDDFESAINDFISNKTKSLGFNPTNHKQGGFSKEEWAKMSYSQKAKLFNKSPELANMLMGN